MATNVRIPTQLRTLSAGAATVSIEGDTVSEVLHGLDHAHPGFAARLFDDNGTLRRFINVFLDEEDIRFLQGVETKVGSSATLSIIPAVAGG